MTQRKLRGLDAAQLKIIAMVLMFCDHAWATVIPGNDWLTMVGRLAFPIFAFQLAEGFALTSDRKAYTRRMLLFALLSEIPFNMMVGGGFIYPFHQNVMFTFWLSLLIMGRLERAKQRGGAGYVLSAAGWLVGGYLIATLLMLDYFGYGVWMVLLFHLTRDMPARVRYPLQGVGMVLINWVLMEGRYIPLTLLGIAIDPPIQAFAIFALIPIWLYNGEKGRLHPVVKPMAYWFYPVHILILSVIWLYVLN